MVARVLATVGCVALLAACNVARPPASGGSAALQTSSELPASPCRDAPAWLVDELQGTLTPPGSGLSRIFVVRAANITGDPRAAGFDDPWWVGALINGVGVRPAPARWLIASLDRAADAQILAADVNARRYSNVPSGGEALDGEGFATVLGCVGPAPLP
jgi:hypothetical protein